MNVRTCRLWFIMFQNGVKGKLHSGRQPTLNKEHLKENMKSVTH